MSDTGKNVLSISEQIEQIKTEMCDYYCKYPKEARLKFDDGEEAMEWLQKEYCDECPLGRL